MSAEGFFETGFGVVRKNVFPRREKDFDLGVGFRHEFDDEAPREACQKLRDASKRNIVRKSNVVDQGEGHHGIGGGAMSGLEMSFKWLALSNGLAAQLPAG